MGMGSIRARQPHPSGPTPEANLLRSRLKSVPKPAQTADSPEFGRAGARDPLTRRAGTRQMTRGAKHSQALGAWNAQVDLPRLNKTCHNLVKAIRIPAQIVLHPVHRPWMAVELST